MATAAALSGFNDLRRLVTPTFPPRNRFIYNSLHIAQKWTKMNKNQNQNLLEQYLAESISLQRSNWIIFGLTDIVALFANRRSPIFQL